MKYCADTWFILQLFSKDSRALDLIKEARYGKVEIIIPVIVFAEATKKLLQRGVPFSFIDQFFTFVDASEKIEVSVLDKVIAQEAARISLSFQLPMIDSLVAATAKLSGCSILLTADSDYLLLSKRKYFKTQSW